MIEVSLTHDGRAWVAWDGTFTVRGDTLVELDRAVAGALRGQHRTGATAQVPVRMAFDTAAIPEWMRQYAQHYFNRLVMMDLRPAADAPATQGEGPCPPT